MSHKLCSKQEVAPTIRGVFGIAEIPKTELDDWRHSARTTLRESTSTPDKRRKLSAAVSLQSLLVSHQSHEHSPTPLCIISLLKCNILGGVTTPPAVRRTVPAGPISPLSRNQALSNTHLYLLFRCQPRLPVVLYTIEKFCQKAKIVLQIPELGFPQLHAAPRE